VLRGENIVCGTSTTGTGTLTLAATPVAPGGIDFDVLARATGNGFANSAAVLVSYTIIEYTDTTFATAKSIEKGIGTLTLGGSSGIANCTLARTTPQVTATSLNSQPATYNTNAPSAVSITTAANVLVFIGASAADISAWEPYYESSVGDALGASPVFGGLSGVGSANLSTAKDFYQPFEWRIPMLVKKASVRVQTAYSGGTPVSNAYMRIYAINSSGRPGKLLIDFGLLGTANASLNTGSANISSAAHSTGYFLTPGHYFMSFICTLSGGSISPKLLTSSTNAVFSPGFLGTTNLEPNTVATATSGTATPAPDTANTTGYAVAVASSVQNYFFTLSPS